MDRIYIYIYNIYIYVCIYMYVCMYIYVYIYANQNFLHCVSSFEGIYFLYIYKKL